MVGEAQGALEHILRMTYTVWVSVIQEGFLEEMTFKLICNLKDEGELGMVW